MARTLSEKVAEVPRRAPFIGHQVLDIITSGMYDDPLMVYREYIQNSVDSIDVATQRGLFPSDGGRISILISGLNRTVSIEDNGAGLSEENAGWLFTHSKAARIRTLQFFIWSITSWPTPEYTSFRCY